MQVLQQRKITVLPLIILKNTCYYAYKQIKFLRKNEPVYKKLTASKNIKTYAFWYPLYSIIFFPPEK